MTEPPPSADATGPPPGTLLECVPNVSEGRDAAALGALERHLAAVPGLRLLDLAPDRDHHRSVVTLAGTAETLRDGVLALFAWAAEHVDLRHHRGVHPRVGAVDVVPFVPLAGATMADAVAAAEGTAAAIADAFDLPVYLYEEAARRPHRRLLADIRRGQFEGFAAKIAQPDWVPDFGPRRVHPTLGVAVVGARFFLLAVNARLATADVTAARAVARAVREATGGLPGVRALGLLLESRGCAQVSMNLVDFRRTSLVELLARVEAEARAQGTEVVATELVGLAPAAALLEPLRALLRTDALGPRQIVEWRLLEEDSRAR
jgi:glutamate formiminotransferase / 5-formyltetrahydrofolate cyclo-ligase